MWHNNMENAHKTVQDRFNFHFQFREQGTFFFLEWNLRSSYFPKNLVIPLKNHRNLNKKMHKKQGVPELCFKGVSNLEGARGILCPPPS